MGPPATRPGRVGFDAIRALRNRSGLGNYSRLLLRGLHQAAPELHPLLYAPRPPLPEFSALVEEIGGELRLPPSALSLPPLPQIWRTCRLGRAAARDRIELYHGLSHEIPRDLPHHRIPSVVTFHDLLFETHPELFPPLDRTSYRWRYRWSAEHASAVIAVSSATRRELLELYRLPAERIVVIPPGCDPQFARLVPQPQRDNLLRKYQLPTGYLLLVGTLEPRKNQRLALAALAVLPKNTPPLVLVGRDGGSEASLRAELQRRGLSQNVLIRGTIAEGDLPALVQSAQVALYLSTAEGFGMPIVEAMSAGVPVIAAQGEHLQDAAGDAAIRVPPDDPGTLAEAITSLLSDQARRASCRALGLRHATRFDPVQLAEQVLSVYHAVLHQQPVSPQTLSPTRDPSL